MVIGLVHWLSCYLVRTSTNRLPAGNIIRGPSGSVNDRHLCMCDKHRRRDSFQNVQHSANYVHEEQSRDKQVVAISSRVSTFYARNAWDSSFGDQDNITGALLRKPQLYVTKLNTNSICACL